MSLKHFDELPEGERTPKPAAQRAGVHSDNLIPTEALVSSVEDGSDLHDSLMRLAYRGWTEAQLYDLMDQSAAREADPVRWQKRRGEIPALVKSAGKDPASVFGDVSPEPPQSTPSVGPFAPALATPRNPARAVALSPINVASLPRRSWLVYALLLDGSVTVATAPGGFGKSAWGLRLALAVASGQSFGKWEVNERRRVLIINSEDDGDELQRRAAANFDDTLGNAEIGDRLLRFESDDIALVRRGVGYGATIQRTPTYEDLRETIRAERIGFVVADPLIELSAGLNENDNADMDALMRALRDIAREFQIPVLVIHHAKKGGDGGQDSSRGAGAIINNARVAVTLGPLTDKEAKGLPKGYYGKVQVVKSNYAPKGEPHVLEFQNLRLGNGDLMARVVYVDHDLTAAGDFEFEHWPELLEMVRAGRNGEPWKVSDRAPKAERLGDAVVTRWRLPPATVTAILNQGLACGRLAVEELPTRYKPKVWRVGPTPDAPLLPWLKAGE